MASLPVEGYDQLGNATGLPVASPEPTMPTQEPNTYDTIINRLLGTGGEERYQTWPEKMVRDALAAPSQAIAAGTAPNPYKEGSEEWQDFESRRGAALPQALNMAALAGTGGLGGVGAEAGATLGAGPFLRPALKFNEKIYKAPHGGQHLDALPKEMIPEFNRLAMSGEDISHYDFGFMNHKGQFLNREKALDYAIKEGLIDPNSEAARAGVLTSTMDLNADSSKPAAAIKLYRGINNGNKVGNFYTENKDFAREFTQSGLDKEILERYIDPTLIHDARNVYAGDEAGMANAINEAKKKGLSALRVSEDKGIDDGNHSIFVIDRKALKNAP